MIVIALGKKGSGKSALLRKLAYRRLASPARPLIFYHDPGCQIAPGAGRVFTDLGRARAELAKAGGLPQLSIFRGIDDVEGLARLAVDVRGCTLILDELDRACRGKQWAAPTVRRIVHEGRHLCVDLWGSFRRTANVSEDLLHAADFVFLFRHSEAAYYDLQTIAARLGPRYATAARELDPGRFVAWTDD